MSRETAIAKAHAYVDDGQFEREIAHRVSFRTESQKKESLGELVRYLDEEIIPSFEAMGFSCRKFDNPIEGLGPFLLAERHEGADLPTVLGYGHGDVIRGQETLWSKGKGPWITARDGDRLYGRGTADNKGQHTVNMAATRCVLETRGKLGYNAKFLIEMGEECGSLGLREIVEANLDAFTADVFIGSDGPRANPDRPTLTLGARGAMNFDLLVDLRKGGHHSGNWGGLIADPAIILSNAIATIAGPSGEILIDEWLPPPMPKSVKDALADIEIEAGAGAPEIDEDWGAPGLSPAERVYGWNSFAVLAMTSGQPEAPVNAISPNARAHCQLRFFAGTNMDDILPALRRHLDKHGFADVQVLPPPKANDGAFNASRTDPEHPWTIWVCKSMERTDGKRPVVIPSMGGSICNDIFTDVLNVPAIWIPHSYAACSQHAPDEHVLMPTIRSAMEIMTGLYWDLGENGTPG